MLSADVQITTEHAVCFWKPPTVFTQWSPSRVVIVGVSDVCAEQYMMAEKARTFGDEEGRRRILSTDDPREHKRLGRQLRGFSEERWRQHREGSVFRDSMAKSSQNPELKQPILATGGRILAEVSPLD